jgi:CRISPR-associated protein Cmr4
MNNIKRHLLTLYTRTPLHVGSGTSVDVVDLPIMRERITGFPVIPSTSLKGVLLQHAREVFEDGAHSRANIIPLDAKILFGAADTIGEGSEKKQVSNAGCVQIMEAKLLAFPVRSLAGCFAWLTCPAVLERFQRDTGKKFVVPQPSKDQAVVTDDSSLTIPEQAQIVLEEYVLALAPKPINAQTVVKALTPVCSDPLWVESVGKRLVVLNDENFQHFVATATEVVARIKVAPASRTVDGEALFYQENVPCEALFYSVLTVLLPRRDTGEKDHAKALSGANAKLEQLFPDEKQPGKHPPILQIGGDETTGHGLCETKREELQ